MTNPFVRIWIHCFFGTKDFMPLILDNFKDALLEKIKLKFENEFKCQIKNISAENNHVHVLFLLNPNFKITDIFKNIKGETSHWVNLNNFIEAKFTWQKSYFALSVSESQIEKVNQYISNQSVYHTKHTFQQEINEFAKKVL
ncbi:MAG: hypothetical protein HGGPFJEG_01576 [Ignavibacteria bacterium]|nr:hypothetical protein [Ignavibacteria bacterium]